MLKFVRYLFEYTELAKAKLGHDKKGHCVTHTYPAWGD